MRVEAFAAALLVLSACANPASADLIDAPQFNAGETAIIARNEVLRAIVERDPWLVRGILDLLARPSPAAIPPEPLDSAANPDLATRNSQGSVEWNELIRRARQEKDQRGKIAPGLAPRSSEGSVELIEMMRRAKAAKDAVR